MKRGQIDSDDVALAMRLVEAAGRYYNEVSKSEFDPKAYRKVEAELHEVALSYGARLVALRAEEE